MTRRPIHLGRPACARAALIVVSVLLLGSGTGRAQAARRVPVPAHPLEQWGLGAAPVVALIPAPAVPPREQLPDTAAVVLPDFGPIAQPDSVGDESVEVVRCRQVLVSDPKRAALLGRMLQQGEALDVATRKLGMVDFEQTVRDYALPDINAGLRAQIETLPDSAWSEGLPWRGRTAYVQVLARQQRSRSSLPKLGEGLNETERQSLARRQRLQVRDQARETLDPGIEPAAVVEQAAPEYPAAATGAGEVQLLVDVGRLGEVLNVKVEYASDPIFETPAIEAARNSRYRTARRPPGIAEPGTVKMTYKFAAPDAPPSDPQEQP